MTYPKPDVQIKDPAVREYIAHLEKLALSRTVYASSNNKFPLGWSFERWVSILTLLAMLAVWVFGAGGEWRSATRVAADLATLTQSVSAERMYVDNTFARKDVVSVALENLQRSIDALRKATR